MWRGYVEEEIVGRVEESERGEMRFNWPRGKRDRDSHDTAKSWIALSIGCR